ncbi:bis(5'-nucleosyl)-tetraphosphatase (symmetrical) YqeK [Alkalicoccus urumqiensis]|uniref:bis(5'-nucleosyl)-tetraphosphatase (symmetrical) n=1 Tax=Alkalicoccus urumqiensis TaxID=1548213 RepID=A0A2P6MFJ0_ALKUR|nr:bis(5'-nucleosyl)-tetraphosphatase (symmetrical) YqeK [Alkalicoccus urumqiensis]PRO65079.1 phosphohydrolase [Alkalicoccus urumqiensis]
MWTEAEAAAIVRPALKKRRYEHTERVVETADELCTRYGGDRGKIRLASWLHDYAKYREPEEMRALEGQGTVPEGLGGFGNELLHSFCGAELLKREHGLEDEAVLQMIASHTTGRAGMSLEEKIVFLADYIEPGRTFDGAETARAEAESSLDKACCTALAQTIQFLTAKRLPVYPDTLAAYNDLLPGTVR